MRRGMKDLRSLTRHADGRPDMAPFEWPASSATIVTGGRRTMAAFTQARGPRGNAPNRPQGRPMLCCAPVTATETSSHAPRHRLDALLVERGLAPSRDRARALILAREVLVDGV